MCSRPVSAVGAVGLLDNVRALGDSRPFRYLESCRKL